MPEECEANSSDWVANRGLFFVTWGLPIMLMVVARLAHLTPMATGTIWFGALIWMGFACLKNARQCGRMHCFFTGPFFLFSAVLAVVVGMQWTQVFSFNGLGVTLLIGTPLFWVIPEVLWGTYKQPKEHKH